MSTDSLLTSAATATTDAVVATSASASLVAARLADSAIISSSVGPKRLVKRTTGLDPCAKSRVSFLVSCNYVKSRANVLTYLPSKT